MESNGLNGNTKGDYENDLSMFTRIVIQSKIRRRGMKRILCREEINTG